MKKNILPGILLVLILACTCFIQPGIKVKAEHPLIQMVQDGAAIIVKAPQPMQARLCQGCPPQCIGTYAVIQSLHARIEVVGQNARLCRESDSCSICLEDGLGHIYTRIPLPGTLRIGLMTDGN